MLRELMHARMGPPPPPPPAPQSFSISSSDENWKPFFDERLTVETAAEHKFRVLSAGPHDGGELRTTFLLLHGAGHSAMTFALAAHAMKGRARVVAFDMRGHGETRTLDDADLSADTLAADAAAVANAAETDVRTPLVLVGHSMGGAVAVRAANGGAIRARIAGIAVLDVVEGTALAALPSMLAVLAAMPAAFPDVQHAVAWSIGSGSGTRNMASARVSLPSQLRKTPDGLQLTWRTDLRASERFWRGWFEGLSDGFLRVRAPRLLVLAGTDRLDKPLTIGHMQGKFQLKLLPNSGHLIPEDEPEETAATLLAFAQRFVASAAKLPPKISVVASHPPSH